MTIQWTPRLRRYRRMNTLFGALTLLVCMTGVARAQASPSELAAAQAVGMAFLKAARLQLAGARLRYRRSGFTGGDAGQCRCTTLVRGARPAVGDAGGIQAQQLSDVSRGQSPSAALSRAWNSRRRVNAYLLYERDDDPPISLDEVRTSGPNILFLRRGLDSWWVLPRQNVSMNMLSSIGVACPAAVKRN